MTKNTAQDEVWNCALRYALLEESFKLPRISDEIASDTSDRTIRDTLNTMVDCGWLDKKSQQAHTWQPGPKAYDIENVEENFNNSPPRQSDPDVYSPVDEVRERYSDRVSNSANLVIEEIDDGHTLGSHGPLEEFVKIPYRDGDPIRVAPPRLGGELRALVCRDQDIVWGDDGAGCIKQPELRVGDILPLHIPLLFRSEETEKEVHPEELDGVPLPLFTNVHSLQFTNGVELDSGRQYAMEIDSLSDGTAIGIEYSQSKWRRRGSTVGLLNRIAENAGTVTESGNDDSTNRARSDWDDHKKTFLNDIANTYD